MRGLIGAIRTRDPLPDGLADRMATQQNIFADKLKFPSDDERADGVRASVWPVAETIAH